jgi:tRNA dimethylallyltransferase
MKTNKKSFSQLAIIGSTASGKTALSIKLSKQMNAYILSLDSLSIYKEIDIVSAKPTLKERADIMHFGIDYLYPNQIFDVTIFIKLYHEVYQRCLDENKHLIIVGGTSFYLKMLIDGISELPSISQATKDKAIPLLDTLEETYTWLDTLDNTYISTIASTDRYRIEKALYIYLETGLTPTEYFTKHPPLPTISEPLPIYQIVWEREVLRKRIALRTQLMVNDGLIDEVCMLEKKYSRTPNAMKSIGIKETLAYLDGIYDKQMLIEKITTNTSRLAKRQTTFNNSQFSEVIKGSIKELENLLLL